MVVAHEGNDLRQKSARESTVYQKHEQYVTASHKLLLWNLSKQNINHKEEDMYKVKATVVDIKGDQEKFPCHAGHKVGDEAFFNGDTWTGRFCVDLWPGVASKAAAIHAAGPKYVEPVSHYVFNYVSVSRSDPGKKIYDGLGFKNVFEGYDLPKYHMANLVGGSNAFKWPPPREKVVRPVTVMCPDLRTAVVVKLEAIDVAEGGFALPYFRRQMVILDRVLKKQGIQTDQILNEFSKEEQLEIYPPLSPIEVQVLVEELVDVGHMEIKDGEARVIKKGEVKVDDFKKGLTPEERKALSL